MFCRNSVTSKAVKAQMPKGINAITNSVTFKTTLKSELKIRCSILLFSSGIFKAAMPMRKATKAIAITLFLGMPERNLKGQYLIKRIDRNRFVKEPDPQMPSLSKKREQDQ